MGNDRAQVRRILLTCSGGPFFGKTPDELECLGKTVFKKSTFFVFRFRSDSENLEENQRGKWLICCSAPELGIFSPFAEYEKYQKKTPEKTLKHIIRKLIKTKK